jgi:hypothetical protein
MEHQPGSALRAYLEQHFPACTFHAEWDDKTLIRHFFTTFGCNLWLEGEFYLFKYEVGEICTP